MKIAFFHLAFLYSGGGEKLALKQVELLRERGYEVDCFAPLVDTQNCYPEYINKVKVQEILPGISRWFLNKPELGVILVSLLFPFLALKFKKYDVIFGANQPGPLFGFILKVILGKPYIAYIAQPTRIIYRRKIDKQEGLQIKNTMHILPHIFNICRPFLYWIDLKSIFCADKVFTNGEYMQDVLKNIYSVEPIICSPGAQYKDTEEINNKIDTLKGINLKAPFILLSNRHVPHKKFEYALYILDKMSKKVPLVITGEETSYTAQLKKLVSYLKLDKYVSFLGYVDQETLGTLYRNCTLYLYTAPEEDFGMGVIEAMGYGKPVIAWNHAGPSKIITNEYDGFLVNFKDTTNVLHCIENLLSNKELYSKIAENARNTIKNNYSWDRNSQIMNESLIEIAPKLATVPTPSTIPALDIIESN